MPTDISKIISDAAYQAYERRLLHQVRQAAIPHHVAIIMDGNRRFAREIGLGNVLDGHVKGRDKLEEVLEWCLEVGVRILTVYAFSIENLRRPSEEIQHLMHLFAENFRKVGDDDRVHRHKIRINVFGDRELLPAEVIEAIEYAEARTKDYESYRFNLAVAYGGREEILQAIRDVVRDAQAGKVDPHDIDEKFFSKRLYTADMPDPDLVLRTSGEERISNFLLLQLAYSELYFLVASIAVKLYGVGALAVGVRTPFEANVLRDLRPFAGLRIRAGDKEESLDAYCRRLVDRIIEDLVPFLHDSYDVNVDPEPYTVYCVSVTETPVRVFTTAWRREVTALLANDPRPDAISDEEVDDTWRNWFSYYQDDLVVLDWDAALVIEPSASYEDTLTVFELANLQLLELRTYDAFLDKVVDKAYDDLEDLFARSSFLRSGHETVKELAEVRMDLAEASFQVDNISKLWGDWFLGKVYRACAKKFELDSWRRNVEEKMKDLSEIYEVAEAELEARRLLILEVLVVLLFIVDLVLIAYRG